MWLLFFSFEKYGRWLVGRWLGILWQCVLYHGLLEFLGSINNDLKVSVNTGYLVAIEEGEVS